MGAIVFSAMALCLVLYAMLFYLVLKDAEDDRCHGPHEVSWEIKEYAQFGLHCWEVWSVKHPDISLSGEADTREKAVSQTRRAVRDVRDELVYGKMDGESGDIWT